MGKTLDHMLSDLYIFMNNMDTELTTEFTLTIRLGEPLIREGNSSIESNAGAR